LLSGLLDDCIACYIIDGKGDGPDFAAASNYEACREKNPASIMM
jgi:hypothetical protein